MDEIDIEDAECVKLPSDFFPETWTNDERMGVLMAQFRPRSVNAIFYDSKMLFWKNLIIKYCEIKGCSIVTESELRCAFQRNNRKPYSISTVLTEMHRNREIQSSNEFMSSIPCSTWIGWAVNQMTKPMYWGWNKIKERVLPDNKPAQYVVIEAVKKQSEKLLKTVPCNKIISLDELKKKISQLDITDDGAKYAVQYLKVKGHACELMVELSGIPQTIIKFVSVNTAEGGGKCEISEKDVSLYDMKYQETVLIKSVETLEHEINNLEDIVRKYVRENKKQLARNHLKKKHVLQKQLENKSNQLDNLQTLLLTFDDTEHNAHIIRTLQMGSNTLRRTMIDSGVTVESVDDLHEDLKEQINDQQEIQDIINTPIGNSSNVNDAELEEELNDLLKADEKSKENEKHDESIEQKLRTLSVNGLPDLNSTMRSQQLNVAQQQEF